MAVKHIHTHRNDILFTSIVFISITEATN